MSEAPAPDLKYPIGKFQRPASVTPAERAAFIQEIATLPADLRRAVIGLTSEQLDTPYRPGGWTVRQVVHHVADSHINSYVRLRLALTEEEPPVKGYDEAQWAELQDARRLDPEVSLTLLEALHQRWVALLKSMTDEQFARGFKHSELGVIRLDVNTALYAWHSRHHVAHITALRQREGWL
jgi:hypothetical protein